MNNDKLTILWTSGEKDVAMKVAFRYADEVVQKNLWREVELLVWGASVLLAGSDADIKSKLLNLMEVGIQVKACIVCADEYEVTQELEDMGIELIMVSEHMNDIIANQKPLLSL